jgi:hypothetical protein
VEKLLASTVLGECSEYWCSMFVRDCQALIDRAATPLVGSPPALTSFPLDDADCGKSGLEIAFKGG